MLHFFGWRLPDYHESSKSTYQYVSNTYTKSNQTTGSIKQTKSMMFILEQTPKNMKIISQQYIVKCHFSSLGSKICHFVSPDSFVVIHHKHQWLRPYRLHGSHGHGLWCMDTAHHVLSGRSHRGTGEFLVGCCFVTTKIWGSSTKGQLEMWNFGKRDMLIFNLIGLVSDIWI